MRSLLTLSLLGILAVPALGGEEKKLDVPPIKVVALDRKDPVDYLKDVDPILVKKCAFCHSGNVKEGKFDLSSYETLMKGGKRGKPVVAGKSADSLLIKL